MTKIARAKALGYLAAGWSISGVAREMNRSKSSISELAKKARKVGEDLVHGHHQGVLQDPGTQHAQQTPGCN